MADDAGALLVRSGLVSSAALDEARAKVADQGGTLGEHLVVAATVDDDKLTAFYKQRLLVPQVNPNTLARLPAKVVAVIPSEMAIELRAIPVSLDSDNNLTVAMSDPSDRHAVDEISFITGAYVVRAVATQMQIAWCLAHYYGHVTELGERLLQPEEGAPAARARSDSQAGPRKRGVTGEVAASRHKGIVPGEAFAEGTKPAAETAAPEAVPENRRSKTASGEIRVPRAPSIKPPLPDDSGPVIIEDAVPVETGQISVESGPVMVMEVDSGPIEAPVGRESDQAIEILAPEGSPYEPMMEIEDGKSKPVPRRRRPAEPDPPELAARAGEVQLATGQSIKQIVFDEPAIIVSDELNEDFDPRKSAQVSGELAGREHRDRGPSDDELSSIFVELGEEDAPVLIHDTRVDESGPVLLDRQKDPTVTVTLTGVPKAEIHDESEPIVLPPKRAAAIKRKPAKTQVGIGAVTAATRRALGVATPESGVPTEEMEDVPTDARRTLDADPTRVELHAVPPRDDDTSDEVLAAPPGPYSGRDTSPYVVPPPTSNPTPGASGKIRLDGVKRAEYEADEEDTVTGSPTSVMSAVELDDVIPNRTSGVIPAHLERKTPPRAQSPAAEEDLDDGWGPPGTTIPPPLLGAIPGSVTPASGIIPIPDMDSAPLIVAPPLPPERGVRAQTATEAGLQRALEEATLRVLELIHTLDHATDRDQIIAVMIAHLADSHRRAGFFAMRAGALSLFAITPRVPEMSDAQLRLDRPSTLGDVVGTRLPYRGPMLDEISRAFLTATLGASPPEILLVPIAVRERVVGVLFGDQRMKHTFDDQLALAARAAGMALERLLKTKRG